MRTALALKSPATRIGPAGPRDGRAVRLLLRDAAHPVLQPCVLTAKASGRVVAAAAIHAGPLTPVPGTALTTHVAVAYRGQGIGADLIACAQARSRAIGARAVYARRTMAPDSEEHQVWQRFGYTSSVSVRSYEADPQRIVALLGPLCDRLIRHARVPAQARVIPLSEAPWATVADLHARYLGGHPLAILARVNGRAPEPYYLDSPVLMFADRVAGFLLAREAAPGVSMTEAAVVIPEFRNDWANLLLKRAAAERMVQLGRTASRFVAYDRHRDTRSFARMVGADVIDERVMPYRILDESSGR